MLTMLHEMPFNTQGCSQNTTNWIKINLQNRFYDEKTY